MDAAWQWFIRTFGDSEVLVVITILGFGLAIYSAYLGWQSKKMILPGKVTKARTEIAEYLLQYLIKTPNASYNDITIIVDSQINKHEIGFESLSKAEILDELRTYIRLSLMPNLKKQKLLEKLDKCLDDTTWEVVEKEISDLFDERGLIKSKVAGDKKHAKDQILEVFRNHLDLVERIHYNKVIIFGKVLNRMCVKLLLIGVMFGLLMVMQLYFTGVLGVMLNSLLLYILWISYYQMIIFINGLTRGIIIFLGSVESSRRRLENVLKHVIK